MDCTQCAAGTHDNTVIIGDDRKARCGCCKAVLDTSVLIARLLGKDLDHA